MNLEFRYEIRGPVANPRPGHHRSLGGGGGIEFRTLQPLSAHPDARRLDVHASCRHPNGDYLVRVYRERRALSVWVLADLSASMGFRGVHRKLDVVADFVSAAARSAHRTGDYFGFAGANASPIEELQLSPTRFKEAGEALAVKLRTYQPSGDSAAGLIDAAARLSRRRALVFVLSDFHLPLPQLDLLLDTLAKHWVVPVILWDCAELEPAEGWGLKTLRDLETGRRRLMLMRPALRKTIRADWVNRRDALQACCLRHGVRPLTLTAGFDADRVTEYFLDPDAATT